MELREYLESDIILFLDRRLSAEYLREQTRAQTKERGRVARDDEIAAAFLSRDYEKELFAALAENNINKAKIILHHVKDEFHTYPEGSVERRQLRSLLHSLYAKFKDHMEDEQTFDKFEEALGGDEFSDSSPERPVASRPPTGTPLKAPTRPPEPPKELPKIDLPKEATKKEAPAPLVSRPEVSNQEMLSNREMPKQEVPKTESTHSPPPKGQRTEEMKDEGGDLLTFLGHLEAMNAAIVAGDVARAHYHYTNAKSSFAKLPPQHKKTHYQRMLEHHKKITSLMQEKQNEKKKQRSPAPAAPFPNSAPFSNSAPLAPAHPPVPQQEPLQTLPSSLRRFESEIESALAGHDLREAMFAYERLRAEVLRLPADGRAVEEGRLKNLYTRIAELRRSATPLSATPPSATLPPATPPPATPPPATPLATSRTHAPVGKPARPHPAVGLHGSKLLESHEKRLSHQKP